MVSGGVPLVGQARVARGSVHVGFGDEPSSTESNPLHNQRAMTLKDHGEPWADPIARVGRPGSRSVETCKAVSLLAGMRWPGEAIKSPYSCVKPSQLSRRANKFHAANAQDTANE